MDTLSTFPPQPRRRGCATIITVIEAQNIAKARRSPAERAWLAAKWITGMLQIEGRTAVMAARAFGCSAGSVHRALAEINTVDVTTALLSFHWQRATAEQRAAFVAQHLDSVWAEVERATGPMRQAAE